MRQHDEMFDHKHVTKHGGDKRLLKGGVNNDPLDLVYKKSDYLAAEEKILSAARFAKLKRKEGGSPLKTKSNQRAIEAIERRKDEEFLASEEKRIRLQRKKDFSEQVRDSFLPASAAGMSGTMRSDSDGRHVQWGADPAFSSYTLGDFAASSSKVGNTSGHYPTSLDAPHQQIRKVNKQSVASSRGKAPEPPAPRPVKAGSDWIAHVLESDKEEEKLADVYEIAFSSFF